MDRSATILYSGVALLLVVAVAAFVWSSQGYGEVSPGAYKVAKALYSTCLSESRERLESVVTLLNDDESELEISATERKWLEQMIDDAKNGKWEMAAKAARRMMEDQIEY